MKRAIAAAAAYACLALLAAAPASAAFGLHGFDVTFTNADGSMATQAGSHPFAMTTSFEANTTEAGGKVVLDQAIKDVLIAQVPGFVGTPTPVPRCATADFVIVNPVDSSLGGQCADGTAVGKATVLFAPEGGNAGMTGMTTSPIHLLEPSPGIAARLGFWVVGVPVVVDIGVSESPPYNVIAISRNTSQLVEFFGIKFTLWGNPASPVHDKERGACYKGLKSCSADAPVRPFITLPRACEGSLATSYATASWQHPGTYLPSGGPDLSNPNWLTGEALTHDEVGNPRGMSGCGKLGFSPTVTARPTSKAATSPTGLDFSLDVKDEGLTNPAGIANSDIRKTVVTLPQGMSVNPSQAEGLEVCSESQLAKETAFSAPGAGCPNASKIGTVEVETPLLEDKILRGALYVAKPYENPFKSLLALYIVIKNPELGISITQAARVIPDPVTGQLTTVAEGMPQQPFSHFRLHFREGTRSPLVTPPACGSHAVKAVLYPWSGGPAITTNSIFEVISGPDAGPCPTGGLPPFHPNLTAGTLNNAAGRFSPFNVKLTRTDAEQEFTNFSIKLPPGIAGKLAGIPFCSDAAIAAATARTGPHGGREELDSPSCPAASQVGRSLAGAGAGPSLAYAPGKVYLAGPYHGHPVSLVAITAGVVGPFDIGTVVVRLALDVNPETGEVFLDSTGSDPIPHIVKGIPVHLRDIRAYTDRPEFTFNPTSCEPTSTSATVLGSGLDFVSAADDNPFVSTSRFQAADCAALPFKPKLTLKLVGQKKRAGNPALKAHLDMSGMGPTGANEAGLAYARVGLPKTLFLDNAHIDTICTRVQFKAGAVEGEQCPPGSIIGTATASTPILDQPLAGPIYLRSNPERELPDIAASLQGQQISVVAVGHTDSSKGGGLRNTFEVIPDAPITSVDINLFGGKRGLIESSRNLCSYKPRAKVEFKGHNGKTKNYPHLRIKATGCKKKKGKKKSKRHSRRARAERVG